MICGNMLLCRMTRARAAVGRCLEPLLRGTTLSKAQIDSLARNGVERCFAPGEVIVRQGVRGDVWGVILCGRVEVERTGTQLPAGGTFGEEMYIEGLPSTCTLRAVTRTRCVLLRRADLLAQARHLAPVRQPLHWRQWVPTTAFLVLWVVLALGIPAWVSTARARSSKQGEPSTSETSAVQSRYLEIVSPPHRAPVQQSAQLDVQALVPAQDVAWVELWVDGRGVGQKVTPSEAGSLSPAVLTWTWPQEGVHALVVHAAGRGGGSWTSAAITVTVVPPGVITFDSNREGTRAVYRMQSDGRGLVRLTAGLEAAQSPALCPDGSLVYVRPAVSGTLAIDWLAVGSQRAEQVGMGREPACAGPHKLAYVATVDGVGQVFTATIGSGSPVQVTSESVYAGQPAWTVDGQMLAYVVENLGNLDVWASGRGLPPQRVTSEEAMDWAPSWSPDGKYLAFVSNRSGAHQVYVVRSDGSEPRAVTSFPGGAESPSWSPDGRWLALVAYTGEGLGVNAREVYLVRADGGISVRLTVDGFDDSSPQWGLEN